MWAVQYAMLIRQLMLMCVWAIVIVSSYPEKQQGLHTFCSLNTHLLCSDVFSTSLSSTSLSQNVLLSQLELTNLFTSDILGIHLHLSNN